MRREFVKKAFGYSFDIINDFQNGKVIAKMRDHWWDIDEHKYICTCVATCDKEDTFLLSKGVDISIKKCLLWWLSFQKSIEMNTLKSIDREREEVKRHFNEKKYNSKKTYTTTYVYGDREVIVNAEWSRDDDISVYSTDGEPLNDKRNE